MKNKKLLVLVLAAFSFSAVGAVAATGCDPVSHEHSYTWQSNAEGHWEECECGDKKGETADHVDVKNNSTDADGKDGKCDVCDWEIKQVVTFNVGDHGTAPDAQNVSYGAKVSKPADPEADGWNFLGWYKDEDCNTAFDFDVDVISDNTVLYAKWEENTTPGLSAKYAYDLADGAQSLTAKGYVYFKYTATEGGRYQVDLGLGVNNQKCYFTTSLDENGELYGNGQTASTKYFDLSAGDSITIKLSCSETLAADATVNVLVNKVVDEPLPANAWLDGVYTSGGSAHFVLNRAEKTINLMGTPYSFSYVGGSVNAITFEQDFGWGDEYITHFKLESLADGTFRTTATGGSTFTEICLYFPELEEELITSKFAGVYTPVGDSKADSISEITINSDGTGKYVQNGYDQVQEYANYDGQYGILTYGQYMIFPNFVDGVAVSINVFNKDFSHVYVYERTGDVMPNAIPLASNDDYYGDTYRVWSDYGSQFWGEGRTPFTVTDYDKDTDTYTITIDDASYKLVFEGEGNSSVIKLYDGAGANLLDTLKKYFIDYKDLPTTANSTVTMPLADFKKNYGYEGVISYYHFEVKTAGFYNFNVTDENIAVYTGLNKQYPTATYNGKLITGEETVYLAEGSVVCVQCIAETLPESASFTVSLGEAPKGLDESNPHEINGAGSVTVDVLSSGTKLYVKFTPSESGNYLVRVYSSDFGGTYRLLYTVGGIQVGWNDDWMSADYGWVKDGDGNPIIDANNPNYALTVSSTDPVMIVIDGGTGFNGVLVAVTTDYTVGATDLDDFVAGAPVDGKVPASVTVSGSGTYKIADSLGKDVVLTSSSAFTAKCNGVSVEVTEDNGTYTATVNAGTNLYVEVSAGVTFTVYLDQGSEACPYEIDITSGKYTGTVSEGETYFKFTQAGNYVVTCGERWTSAYLNGNEVSSVSAITVQAGDILRVYTDYVTDSVEIVAALPTAAYGNWKYSEDNVLIGAATVSIGDKTYRVSALSGNTYTLTADDNSTITLTVVDEVVSINGTELTSNKPKAVFTDDQVGTYKTSGGLPITLVLNADGSGTYSFISNNFPITATKAEDGTYSFKYNSNGSERTCGLTFNADGSVTVNDSNGFGNNTLVKEAPPAPPVVEEGIVYTGTINDGWYNVTLTLNDEFTEASVVFVDGNGERDVQNNLTLTKNGDSYTANYGSGWLASSFTFTVNADGSLNFTEASYGSGTLNKKA